MIHYLTPGQEEDLLKTNWFLVYTVNDCFHCGNTFPSIPMGVIQDSIKIVEFQGNKYRLCFHCYCEYEKKVKEGKKVTEKFFSQEE